jgi:uncharacterized protein involved in exopolysaccharide biosynthesis
VTAGNRIRSIRLHDILRWWPLLLAAMGVALLSAVWTQAHTAPSYTATTTLMVVPLPQWDETFLGTDLVRDSGDATRTAPTLASQLQSEHFAAAAARDLGGDWTPESVSSAVAITSEGLTNVIDITARASNPDDATRLASGYANAAIADRWQTISAQVDKRIAAIAGDALTGAGDQGGANPAAAEQAGRLRTLAVVRDARADPTLRISATGPALRMPQMSIPVTVVLAVLGGLFVGGLAATVLEYLSAGRNRPSMVANGSSHQMMRTAEGPPLIERKRVDVKQR